jgi:hypothetical protein
VVLGVLGALGARGQVERSGRTTLQKLVQWMDGSKGLRSGGGEGGGGMAKPPEISTGELAESEADGRTSSAA